MMGLLNLISVVMLMMVNTMKVGFPLKRGMVGVERSRSLVDDGVAACCANNNVVLLLFHF